MIYNLELPDILERYEARYEFVRALEKEGGRLVRASRITPWVTVDLPFGPEVQTKRVFPHIKSAEIDATCRSRPLTRAVATGTPWYVDALGLDRAHSMTKGAGVRIATIDTGLSDHPGLRNANVLTRESFVPSEGPEDLYGHGTVSAGLIASSMNQAPGVAPQAELMSLKAMGRYGDGQWSWVAEALERAHELEADVVCMALGGGERSDMVESTIQALTARGVTVIAAAGNSGSGKLDFPGESPFVIPVGAIDSEGNIPGWSSYGHWPQSPDVVAPGVNIPVLREGGIGTASGTSMATALVSGVVALLYSMHPDVRAKRGVDQDRKWGVDLPESVTSVRGSLARGSVDIGLPRDRGGFGLVRADKLIAEVQQRGFPSGGSVLPVLALAGLVGIVLAKRYAK